MNNLSSISPLVSVVIPCYNHGHYLGQAIESVLQQSHREVEVIVVDDGSVDHTREVAQSYGGVQYVYKANAGLSAARNTGIEHSHGEFVVFLDADDWLYPHAIATNLRYLLHNPQAAFVSGAHDKVFLEQNIIIEEKNEVIENHYYHFLQGNYVGMHATVMYQKWVFIKFKFNTTLKTCEDYDLYLRIARQHPVLHHTEKVAAYRMHGTNMSSNIPQMLNDCLMVLNKQKPFLQSNYERAALSKGNKIWKAYYTRALYKQLIRGQTTASKNVLYTLIRFRPYYLIKYGFRKLYYNIFKGK